MSKQKTIEKNLRFLADRVADEKVFTVVGFICTYQFISGELVSNLGHRYSLSSFILDDAITKEFVCLQK